MADTLADLSRNHPSDPDAQAAVTDFLDYTEFFPSDLFRSLTLIGQLDEDYNKDTSKIHDLAKVYGNLTKLASVERPDARVVRRELSSALSHAVRCRESAHAEAARLYNLADGLYNRLVIIKNKLQALPKPPSRDPTPVPQAKSPIISRNSKNDGGRTPRITLHTERARIGSQTQTAKRPRQRVRRIIVPGEVLPPFEDASSNASGSESDSDQIPTPAIHPIRLREKALTEKVLKLPKVTTIRIPRPPSAARARPHGMMGTNVHSQIAGISVSNAMANLQPPPPGFKIGSKHAPWLKLTEWELNKLRKRMKKNADWVPSDTMVRRELAETYRGHENFLKAKANAEAVGGEMIDEEPEAFIRPVTYRGCQGSSIEADITTEQLENRGMKLNQAKKLKRQTLIEEQAAIEQAGQDQDFSEPDAVDTSIEGTSPAEFAGVAGSPTVCSIIIKPRDMLATGPTEPKRVAEAAQEAPRSQKKRKRESDTETMDVAIDPALLVPSEFDTKPVQKKLKLGPPLDIPAATVVEMVDAELVSHTVGIANNHEPTGTTYASSYSGEFIPRKAARETASAMVDAPLEETEPEIASASSSPPPRMKDRPIFELKPPRTAANRTNRVKKSATPIPDSTPAVVGSTNFARPRSRGGAILSLTYSAHKTKAASAEPPSRRASSRRASNVSLPSTQATPKKKNKDEVQSYTDTTIRRGRRPAPGLLASSDINNHDGLQVILGKRKAAPGRKPGKPLTLVTSGHATKRPKSTSTTAIGTPTIAANDTDTDEYHNGERIDPDEPRYCICDRVSFGTMVACENDNCEKEWFHLECVGLEDIPPRRTKWYCPDCRILLKVTEYGDSLDAGAEGKHDGLRQSGRLHK